MLTLAPRWFILLLNFVLLCGIVLSRGASGQPADHLRVLFLGDNGHHQPAQRAKQLIPYLAERGIQVVYTDRVEDLNAQNLNHYNTLLFYGNTPTLSNDQETVLLDFVENGGGLVTVHAGIAMFANSDAYTSLVGATFLSHGVDTMTTRRLLPDHPAIQGVPPIISWDETYIHQKHNPDKLVLSVHEQGGRIEPWTWVRDHGEGRVFYTAWGHDENTWSNPGFHLLLERGLRWAAGDWALSADWSLPALTYVDSVTVPFYPAGVGWGVTGDPFTRAQAPLSPEASMQQTFVEPGFRLELFAAEPDVINPIDLDWDESGRLWVTETIEYPNTFQPERKGKDRIKILEDTDNDGRADRVTVFAEGLNIPTSIVLANGGAIVAQAPDMLFLKDTDGDDRADVREVLFTGFGTHDTHAGPNNLRYGFDNQIWGAVGYSSFSGAVGDGDSLRFGQALFRFTSDGSSIEHMATFNNNTWGLAFSEEGLVFGSTANGNPSLFSAIPERYYRRFGGNRPHVLRSIADDARFYPVTDHVKQVDWHGRYTAGSGYEIYTARSFPAPYWNRIGFIGGPTGHLLGKFAHEPKGSGYTATNEWNMLASRDEWFSPIQVRVGPDGALWVIDWYNLIIQHNPTPAGFEVGEGNAYVNELRDRQHSRIYRVVYEQSGESNSPATLADASPEELVQALTSDNMHWRLTAQRLLVERGRTEVLPQLYALVQDVRVDVLGLNTAAIHALWTMHGLGVLDGNNSDALAVAMSALFHPSNGVRRTALRVLPQTEATLDAILDAGILPNTPVPTGMTYTVPVGLMDAADAQVKLAALLFVADMPFSMPSSNRAASVLVEVLRAPENADDEGLRTAVAAAGLRHNPAFLRLAMNRLTLTEDTTYTANLKHVLGIVAGRHIAQGALKETVDILNQADTSLASVAIEGIAAHWPQDDAYAPTEEDRSALQSLYRNAQALRAPLRELANTWELPELFGDAH